MLPLSSATATHPLNVSPSKHHSFRGSEWEVIALTITCQLGVFAWSYFARQFPIFMKKQQMYGITSPIIAEKHFPKWFLRFTEFIRSTIPLQLLSLLGQSQQFLLLVLRFLIELLFVCVPPLLMVYMPDRGILLLFAIFSNVIVWHCKDLSRIFIKPLFTFKKKASVRQKRVTPSLVLNNAPSIVSLSTPSSNPSHFNNAVTLRLSRSSSSSLNRVELGESTRMVSNKNASLTTSTAGRIFMPFLTPIRATVMIQTMIAILAVDFERWFPTRFRKSSSFGASLMDIGVGVAVATAGLTASMKKRKWKEVLMGSALPCFLIGVGKSILVKGLGYPVPVGEYGLHWNFFVTLALLPVILHIILEIMCMGNIAYLPLVSALIMSVYQYALTGGYLPWLQEFGFSDDEQVRHSSIIAMNKEGLMSLPGFASIYMFSAWLGHKLATLAREEDNNSVLSGRSSNTSSPYRPKFAKFLAFLTLALFIIYAILRWPGGLWPSRRLANLPFCLWTLAFASAHYLLALLFEPDYVGYIPLVVQGVSANQLTIFLAANVGTGLVNLLTKPREASWSMTWVAMLSYAALLAVFAQVLFVYKIRIA